MAGKRLSPLRLSYISITASAAWVSLGALSMASALPGAARIGVLPSGLWLAALFLVAAAVVLSSRARWAPLLSIAALLLLPWLPVRVPPAFYMWVGPLRGWI